MLLLTFLNHFLLQVLSEERVTGNVTTEIRSDGQGGETQGRISYENRGECFFLPYNKDDVEGNVTLRSGDKVSFQIAANPRWVVSTMVPFSLSQFVCECW